MPEPAKNLHQGNLLRRGYAALTQNLARLFSASATATRRTGTFNPSPRTGYYQLKPTVEDYDLGWMYIIIGVSLGVISMAMQRKDASFPEMVIVLVLAFAGGIILFVGIGILMSTPA